MRLTPVADKKMPMAMSCPEDNVHTDTAVTGAQSAFLVHAPEPQNCRGGPAMNWAGSIRYGGASSSAHAGG